MQIRLTITTFTSRPSLSFLDAITHLYKRSCPSVPHYFKMRNTALSRIKSHRFKYNEWRWSSHIWWTLAVLVCKKKRFVLFYGKFTSTTTSVKTITKSAIMTTTSARSSDNFRQIKLQTPERNHSKKEKKKKKKKTTTENHLPSTPTKKK